MAGRLRALCCAFQKIISTCKSRPLSALVDIPHSADNAVICARLLPAASSCMNCTVKRLHTSQRRHDLDEFFDDKNNWGESNIECGRPWRLDEVRLKSNTDLHKLWYVLLKERNMLMTMEHEYNREYELFPSPERIFKVEESMENIMAVVQERDRAYTLLETGKTGEPDYIEERNVLGLKEMKRVTEHSVPKEMNTVYNLLHPKLKPWMTKWMDLYFEKERRKAEREERAEKRERAILKEKFPHADID